MELIWIGIFIGIPAAIGLVLFFGHGDNTTKQDGSTTGTFGTTNRVTPLCSVKRGGVLTSRPKRSTHTVGPPQRVKRGTIFHPAEKREKVRRR